MNVGTSYDQSFYEQVRRDLKDIENKGVSKLETLEDLRDTTGKSFKTADIEKLMEKYDPESYEKYKQFATRPDGGHSTAGLSFLSKWMDGVKADLAKDSNAIGKGNNISAKNEEKLSQKAQDFLKNLRKKYGDYDFMIGNSTDDLKALSKSGGKEFSVIFSSAEIERMANDEKYAEEKMQGVQGAVKMCKRICEENGYVSEFDGGNGENGTINKIGVSIDDNGNMKLFAELEKTSSKQRERIEKNKAKHAEEKKSAEKAKKKNPYEKEDKDTVKRTTIEASSEEELIQKIKDYDWNKIQDSHSGDRFNFTA